MPDLLSGFGSALGAIGGPLVSGGLSLLGGVMQQQGNLQSVQEQERFQDAESSSAYSRAVADMHNAGLNPALMYGAGGPESTPGGASIPAPNILGQVGSSAMDAVRLNMDLGSWVNQQNLTKAQTAKSWADTALTGSKEDVQRFEGDIFKALTPMANEFENFLKSFKLGDALGSSALKRPIPGSFSDSMGSDISGMSEFFHNPSKKTFEGMNLFR